MRKRICIIYYTYTHDMRATALYNYLCTETVCRNLRVGFRPQIFFRLSESAAPWYISPVNAIYLYNNDIILYKIELLFYIIQPDRFIHYIYYHVTPVDLYSHSSETFYTLSVYTYIVYLLYYIFHLTKKTIYTPIPSGGCDFSWN